MEEEGDEEDGEEDEGEEEGGEGVWELETEGEPTLLEPKLWRQWWDLYWVVEEAWPGSGQ